MHQPRPRYKFIAGNADEPHAHQLNAATDQGYKAILMTYNEGGRGSGKTVAVLMELEYAQKPPQ